MSRLVRLNILFYIFLLIFFKFIFELSFMVISHLLKHIILDLFDYIYTLIFLFSLKKIFNSKNMSKKLMYKILCVC